MLRVSTTPTHALSRRRSQRVLMQVGIRVRGKDAQGKDFGEMTETLAINAHGALILLNVRVVSGAIIHLKHNMTEEEQGCHVAFLGPVRSGRAEVGVEFNAPRPTFWRVAFPPEDWSPKNPEAKATRQKVGRGELNSTPTSARPLRTGPRNATWHSCSSSVMLCFRWMIAPLTTRWLRRRDAACVGVVETRNIGTLALFNYTRGSSTVEGHRGGWFSKRLRLFG